MVNAIPVKSGDRAESSAMTPSAQLTAFAVSSPFKSVIILLVALVMSTLSPLGAFAAPAGDETNSSVLHSWQQKLQGIQTILKQPDLETEAIDRCMDQLDQLHIKALELSEQFRPHLSNIEESLDQLGPAPKNGLETEDIAARRRELENERREIGATQKKLDLLLTRIKQTTAAATQSRHARFFQKIFETNRSVFNPNLWIGGIASLRDFAARLSVMTAGWRSAIAGPLTPLGIAVLIVRILLCCAVVALALRGRVRLYRWRGLKRSKTQPTALEKLEWVVTSSPINAICAWLGAFVIFLLLGGWQASDSAWELYQLATLAIVVFTACRALNRGVFSPHAPAWRLTNHDDQVAGRLKRLFDLLALVICIDLVFQGISDLPVQLLATESALTAMAIAVVMILLLLVARPPDQEDGPEQVDVPKQTPDGAPSDLAWTENVLFLYWGIVAITLIALVMGLIELAHFVARQSVVISALVIVLYLLHRSGDELTNEGLGPHHPIGRFLRKVVLLKNPAINRIALLVTTLFDFLLIFFGLTIALVQIVGPWINLRGWTNSLFFGFEIAGVTISPSMILSAIFIFVIGMGLVKAFTFWLENRILARTNLNRGVRDSIKTGSGYAGFLMVIIITLAYAGVNFQNIAIVAGALGVGIGFGLQSVVNNFASGLILLVERPIKVGDWIKFSDGEGYVKRINVRSTEIETFAKCSIIVPNANLISAPVQNWTHSNSMGRVPIRIGVAYNSDPEVVRDILVDCARRNKNTLSSPAPAAHFVGFGESSLDFLLYAYISDVNFRLSVASALRFAIFRAFKENNIEIPFPQRDIIVRAGDPIVSLENLKANRPVGAPPPEAGPPMPEVGDDPMSEAGGE
ncbi:MAG: mechanosensitive ion channel domain-containing protein [Hyphomicrobiales bacterium]